MRVTTPENLQPQVDEMTLDAWADMQEDDPGELVDGRLVEEEVPTVLHESTVSRLQFELSAWLNSRGGRVFGSGLELAVGPTTGRKPDLSVYLSGASLPGRSDALVRIPPSLVVEVVSPAARDVRRDRVEKLADYARFGVAYYWLVDPEHRTVEVLELGTGRYFVALSASNGAHSVPGLDEFVLDIDSLWRHLDELPE